MDPLPSPAGVAVADGTGWPARPAGLGAVASSAIERWFAAAGAPAPIDLARSGAPARTVADLLALARPEDVDAYVEMALDYGPVVGSERLRRAIAGATGAPDPDAVVVTHGAVEGLLLACAASLGDRRLVAVASPAYEGLVRAVEAAGGVAQRVRVWRPGTRRLDLGALAGLDLRRYAAVVVNSPHNPSGLLAASSDLELLAGRCARAGVTLVVDQVAQGTLVPPAPHPWGPETVLVGDVSKAFGLGGLRVGWCVTACPRRLSRLAALRDLTSLGNAGPAQHLAAVALERRQALAVSALAAANLERLTAWVASVPGAHLVPPQDGLVAFPALPLPLPSLPFAERLRAAHGVSVTPGIFFGHDRHLRLGLGLAAEPFAAGLERLGRALRDVGV